MKFDSISTVTEILQFYGKLDEVYRLLRRLNRSANEIWYSNCYEISKHLKRKSVVIGTENKKQLAEYPLKNQLTLIMFTTKTLYIDTEEKYWWLIELLEGVKDPKMLKIDIRLSLSQNRNTQMMLSNYKQYIDYNEFTYLELYRRVIKIASNKEIPYETFNSFIFIHEASEIKDIKYIKFIVIPCRSEDNSETLIKTWNEFTENRSFKFDSVKLIWNDMKLDRFWDLFKAISSSKVNIEIISSKNDFMYLDFLKEIADTKLYSAAYKVSNEDELILYNWKRQVNELLLRKWYYMPHLESKYVYEITNGNLQYFKENNELDPNKAYFEPKDILSFKFNFKVFRVQDLKIKGFKELIQFRDNKIEFSYRLIKEGSFQKRNTNEKIYSYHGELNIASNCILTYFYYKPDSIGQMKISKSSLPQSDISNLINFIKKVGNIASLSLSITDSSSVKILLYLFDEMPFLNSITIRLSKSLNSIEYFEAKSIITDLRLKGKKIWIFKATLTPVIVSK